MATKESANASRRSSGAHRALTRAALEDYVDAWAIKYVVQTLDGDADAAAELAAALDNKKRGHVAVALWNLKIPAMAFSRFLESVWLQDHREVINAAQTKRRLQVMFRYAKFDTSGLPDTIRVWRGTGQLRLAGAVAGYSWTTDRDVACWFAMRFAERHKMPLVVCADISRASVAFYSDERGEKEVVLFRPPVATVDGTPEDWTERFHLVRSSRSTGCTCCVEEKDAHPGGD